MSPKGQVSSDMLLLKKDGNSLVYLPYDSGILFVSKKDGFLECVWILEHVLIQTSHGLSCMAFVTYSINIHLYANTISAVSYLFFIRKQTLIADAHHLQPIESLISFKANLRSLWWVKRFWWCATSTQWPCLLWVCRVHLLCSSCHENIVS